MYRPGTPTGPAARWLAGRTLRTRLVAGLLALFVLACVGVGFATTVALRDFLVSRVDQQLPTLIGLSEALESNDLHQPGGGPGAPIGGRGNRPAPGENDTARDIFSAAQGASVDTLAAWIYQGRLRSTAIVERGKGLVRVAVPPATARTLMSVPPDARSVTRDLGRLGSYRLLAVRGANQDVHIAGLPLHELEATTNQLELIELVVFGIALLATGIVGAGWIGLSLRPLRRMTATATEVTRLPLESGEVDLPHRVADSHPRTEVGQLGLAFNRMLGHVESALAQRQASEAQLRASDAQLRQFVADASHELRTPLASIRGHTELAMREQAELPPDVVHALGRVEAEGVRMSELVDDLLLLARLDAGRPLEQESVDLSRLVLEAANDARAAGPGHRFVLELPDEPVAVRGDPLRLHQVVANLLANARIHTPSGTTVTVRLEDRPENVRGGGVLLAVTDDGPGVPAELQPSVFERFVRGDTGRSRQAGSTGLGLAIVHAVVSAHGGAVRLTSGPGRTAFEVRLPAATEPRVSEPTVSEPTTFEPAAALSPLLRPAERGGLPPG